MTEMDCRQLEEILPDFLENRLQGEVLTHIRAHLRSCSGCRETVRTFRLLIFEAADIDVPDPGESFWNTFLPDLRTKMEQQRPRGTWGGLWRGILLRPAFIGSVVFTAVVVLLIFRYSDLGPRGREAFEAKKLNSRLEFELRGVSPEALHLLDDYLIFDGFPREEPGGTIMAETRPDGISLGEDQTAPRAGTALAEWLDSTYDTRLGYSLGTCPLVGELSGDEMGRLKQTLEQEMIEG